MSSFLRCRLSARYLLSRMYPLQRVFTCFLVPIILSPIPLLIGTKEADCAYVVLIMAYFWLNDSATLPLAVTALIPTFAFPLFAIETANDVAHTYLSDANFIFFGSMVMAVAVEASQLHERIALKTLLFTGPNPRWLMLGFQVATAFLSMWTSNTATTMMMVPIVLAVIRELDLCQRKQNDPEAGYFSNDNEQILDLDNVPEKHLKIYKGLLLSICFAATIGGTGTLIGAGTTVLLNAFLQKHYHHQSPVSFGSYMIYAIPQVIIMIIVCWLWLQFLYIGFRKHDNANDEVIKHILVKKHQNLGPLKYEEKTILITFGILIILWLTRQPVIFPGWGNFFPRKYVTDGTAAMFVSTLLFILPADNPFLAETVDELKPGQQIRTVMTWKLMRDRFSWSTLFLLGGGFAMASGVSSSGLSDWMAMRLTTLQQLPNWVFISVACALVTFLTEFTSNVATASIFIPMVSSFAKTQGVDPILFVIPITFSATFAFMFPAGTPPNAIVFGYKILRVSDMVIGGVVLNIFGFIMCQTMVHTYAYAIFDLKDQIAVNRTLSAIITH